MELLLHHITATTMAIVKMAIIFSCGILDVLKRDKAGNAIKDEKILPCQSQHFFKIYPLTPCKG